MSSVVKGMFGGSKKHWGIVCDGCGEEEFEGERFSCLESPDPFDLCTPCFNKNEDMGDFYKAEVHTMMRFLTPQDVYRAKSNKEGKHLRIVCDFCKKEEFTGYCYHCVKCKIDLCSDCKDEHPEESTCAKGQCEMKALYPPVLPNPYAHNGMNCDGCGKRDWVGVRYMSAVSPNQYDLCPTCFENGVETGKHRNHHPMMRFFRPTDVELAKHNDDMRHFGIGCDGCGKQEFTGTCYHYPGPKLDFCQTCFDKNNVPTPYKYIKTNNNNDPTQIRCLYPPVLYDDKAKKLPTQKEPTKEQTKEEKPAAAASPKATNGSISFFSSFPSIRSSSTTSTVITTASSSSSSSSEEEKKEEDKKDIVHLDTVDKKKDKNAVPCSACDKLDCGFPRFVDVHCDECVMCNDCFRKKAAPKDESIPYAPHHIFMRFLQPEDLRTAKGNASRKKHIGVYCDGCEKPAFTGYCYYDPDQGQDFCQECYDKRTKDEKDLRVLYPPVWPHPFTNTNLFCDGCETSDFFGVRYRCTASADYDMCIKCFLGDVESDKHKKHYPVMRVTGPQPVVKDDEWKGGLQIVCMSCDGPCFPGLAHTNVKTQADVCDPCFQAKKYKGKRDDYRTLLPMVQEKTGGWW